jgi:hypothetical protein
VTVPGVLALGPGAGGELGALFEDGLQLVQRPPQRGLDLARAGLEIDWQSSVELADCGGLEGWDGVARLDWRPSPYPHAAGRRLFAPTLAARWLSLLEAIPRWRPAVAAFYAAEATAIEPASLSLELGPELAALIDDRGLRRLERAASALFGRPLALHGPIVAHRMTCDHAIGVHSDAPAPGEETHRIVILVARDPRPAGGGHFVLLEAPAVDRARRLLPLAHNSAVAFALDARSYHAVTRVTAGHRFSLVLSFAKAPPR